MANQLDSLSDSVSNLLIRKPSHMDPIRLEHRSSLGDNISPKDAVALQYFPTTRNLPSSPTPSPSEHRRTFSASSFSLAPIHSPKSSKRLTWTISTTKPRKNPLTEQEIQGIEKLGVKFVDPIIAPTPSTPPPNIHSPQPPTLIRPAIRRNSIINPKQRRSINLQSTHHTPCSNNHNVPDSDSLKPVPTSVNQLLDLIVSRSAKDPGKENLPPLLVIDLRSLNSYLGPNGRLKGSINVNFPSLLIKRFLKGTPNNFQLHPFITTEAGKRYYSRLEKTYRSNLPTASASSSVLEQLDICVIDDQLNEELGNNNKPHHPAQQNSFGKILLDVLSKWLSSKGKTAGLFYLSGRFEELLKAPAAQKWLLFGEQQTDATRPDGPHFPGPRTDHAVVRPNNSKPVHLTHSLPSTAPHGLLRLRPSAPAPSLPSIDPGSTSTSAASNQTSAPSVTSSSSPSALPNGIVSSSPGHKPKPPKLRRIDTSEQLLGTPRPSGTHPKQLLALLKTDAQTLSVSPKMATCGAGSHSDIRHHPSKSFHSAIPDLSRSHVILGQMGDGFLTNQSVGESQPNHVDERRASSSSPTNQLEMNFKVSTIIPSFLYLGPEPMKESDFEELNKLGIKVILNVALECNKPEEMLDQYDFVEKYYKIPLRDFVEETGIQAGIQKSNQILNHAFLRQFPTYVHCKAGKSRSVTIVLAYLIHRYRWSLKQSYAHVSERRKGVCPNIGFLAELMNFEEREIGSKSRGVTGPVTNKVGRSASHHYSYSSHHTTPTGPKGVREDSRTEERGEEDGERIGFHGYSIDGLASSSSHQPTNNSFDMCRHHGFRVRSMAIGAKTDFFSSLVKPPPPSDPSQDQDGLVDSSNGNGNGKGLGNHQQLVEDSSGLFLKPCRDSLPPSFFRSSHSHSLSSSLISSNPPPANLSPTS